MYLSCTRDRITKILIHSSNSLKFPYLLFKFAEIPLTLMKERTTLFSCVSDTQHSNCWAKTVYWCTVLTANSTQSAVTIPIHVPHRTVRCYDLFQTQQSTFAPSFKYTEHYCITLQTERWTLHNILNKIAHFHVMPWNIKFATFYHHVQKYGTLYRWFFGRHN